MAITNLYPNLPGHLVEFKDGGMQLRSTAVTGNSKSLLILGTAIDGPVNEPVAIDAENVHKLFGNDVNDAGIPNGTTLTKYIRQAYKAGYNDIRGMRVSGSVASATISKDVETSITIEPLTSNLTAKGNDAETVVLPFPGVIPAGQYAAIKQDDINISHPIVNTGIANTFNLPNEVVILANQVPARGDISIAYKTQLVAPSSLINKTNAKVTSNSVLNGSGDNIIEVTIPAADLVSVYEFNMDGLTAGVAAADNHGVPTNASLVAVTTIAAQTIYQSLAIEDALTSTAIVPTSITAQANGDYIVSFVDTGSAGTPSHAINDAFNVDYVGYTEVDGTVTVTQTSLYSPQYVVVAADKLPALAQDVVLYNSTGTNVIAKYSDANGSVVYDAVNTRFVIDLSKVSNTIPLNYITIGASLRVSYSYELVETTAESFTFKSLYGGAIYNAGSITIDKITVDGVEGRLYSLIKPVSKKFTPTEAALSFSSFSYPTFGALRQAIANASLNNVFEGITDYEDATTGDFPVGVAGSLTLSFTGGSDGIGLTNDQMFNALSGVRDVNGNLTAQGAYQILENYHVDNIYVAGIYGDSKVSSTLSKSKSPFQYELALLCAVLTYRTKMTHGFIDMKPNTNTTLVGIQNYVAKLLAYDNTFYMVDQNGDIIYDEENKPMDIGWYTSAVVGPEPICTSNTLGNYYGSAAIAYAALNANLTAQSSPTNKSVPGCNGMRFKFSNKQLNDLTGNRFVVFKLKDEGTTNASRTPYVVDGCTSGATGSDYGRISTVKVVTRVVDEVREVADPFIGEPNTVEQRNALAALISKRLSYLKEQGVIQFFEFEIASTVTQVLSGEASIALTLIPPQELRKITTVVALRATA